MRWKIWVGLILGSAAVATTTMAADDAASLYENRFESAKPGQVPEDMLVLDGGFAVASENGNQFLELPGAPLETYGVLFGPAEKDNISVQARVFATSKGRRFPAFAVSAGGQAGYRLQVSPAKKLLELYRSDVLKTAVALPWTSGTWTYLRLDVIRTGTGTWKVEGRIWADPGHAPTEPAIVHAATGEADLPQGRSGIWGNPFSGTPIRYDDLKVKRLGEPRP